MSILVAAARPISAHSSSTWSRLSLLAAAMLCAVPAAARAQGAVPPDLVAAAALDCVAAAGNGEVREEILAGRGWTVTFRGAIDHRPVTYYGKPGFTGELYSAAFDGLHAQESCLVGSPLGSVEAFAPYVAALTARMGRNADRIRPDFFNEHTWYVGTLEVNLDLNYDPRFQSEPTVSVSVWPRRREG
jgi:hypothetical protein